MKDLGRKIHKSKFDCVGGRLTYYVAIRMDSAQIFLSSVLDRLASLGCIKKAFWQFWSTISVYVILGTRN